MGWQILFIMMILGGPASALTQRVDSAPDGGSAPDSFMAELHEMLAPELSPPQAAHDLGERGAQRPGEWKSQERLPASFVSCGFRIAVLLPLSGAHQALGEQIVAAMKMALFALGDESVCVYVHDTGGTPDGAVQALKLALQDAPHLVVGPLFSKSVQAISPVLHQNGVMALTLTNDERLTSPYTYVFGLTPAQFTQSLASFLKTRSDMRGLLILQPGTYGEMYAKAARDHLSPFIEDIVWVPPRATNPLSQGILQRFEGQDAVGLVIVPGWGQNLLPLAAQMRYALPEKAFSFVGTDWYQGVLLNDPSLDGSYFQGVPLNSREVFYKRYHEIFRTRPSDMALLGYDAMAVAVSLKEALQDAMRIKEGLCTSEGYKTLMGHTRFLPNGVVERQLPLMQVVSRKGAPGHVRVVFDSQGFEGDASKE